MSAPPPALWITPEIWRLFQARTTDAHRLATARDAWLERFGADVLLSYKTAAARETLLAEVKTRCAAYDFQPRRVFGKFIPQHATERDAPLFLVGEKGLPLETEISEAGTRYGLDFAAGYSAGFFIDQRENRAHLQRLAPGKFLNTFAYTCSFSVVAALAGAETVSLDLSRRSLKRGEENFGRNGLDPRAGHRFIADDVLAVLPRLARRGEKFDAIVLDPPTFSRNQSGGAWQVQRDFEKLVVQALDVAATGAHLLLSVNHSAMRAADLEQIARSALRVRTRNGKFSRTPGLIDFPSGEGASTVWLELGN